MNKYFLLFFFIFLKNNSCPEGSEKNSKIKSRFTTLLDDLKICLVNSYIILFCTVKVLTMIIDKGLEKKYPYNYIDKNGKFYHIIGLNNENKNLLPENIIINSEKERSYSCRSYLFCKTYKVTIIKIDDILNPK